MTLNKTLMKHIQNNKKPYENQYQPMDFKKSPEKKSVSQKSQDFCQMFVISKKKTFCVAKYCRT
jgi:hypothetical protein